MTTGSERASSTPAPGAGSHRSGISRLLKKVAKIGVVGIGSIVLVLTIIGLLSKDHIAIPPGHLGQYITVKGDQIRYYQTGAGPDILLIHGLPGLVEDWKPIFEAGAGKYRITAYDRPGHGFSSAPTEYSLARNADVALELIDRLQLKEVIVVGHSYGGAAVLAMAVRNPPQVKAFVSLGGITTPHGGDRFPPTHLTVLKNTGHAIQFAHPEAVISLIDSLNK